MAACYTSISKNFDFVNWSNDKCFLPTTSREVYPMALPESQTYNFIKKETLLQVLSCEFGKFLRTTFLQNTSGLLFLEVRAWKFGLGCFSKTQNLF